MLSSRQRLGELLVSHRLISQEQLENALAAQRHRFQPLGQILMQQNLITEERLLQACALQKGFAAWHLQHDPPTKDALEFVPANLCRSYQILPVQAKAGRLFLAMRDPSDVDALDMVRDLCKLRIEPVLANEDRLAALIEEIHGQAVAVNDTMSKLVTQALDEFTTDQNASDGAVSEAEMRPVVGLINQILAEAIKMRASDIHLEPRKDRVEFRYRIDGQLQKMHEIPNKLQAALIARLKIMAQIDIVEYRIPQDGRIEVTVDGRTIDLRVSILPNYHGQRVVLRVLDKSQTLRQLPELGFSDHNFKLFGDMIQKPYGLVLVTGPTGSGKTTTLYAALNKLKNETNNIMTCEDPVEYAIDGINQSHVNEKVGLTFSAQLRAILRQDPDIVLVGEIRDKETAETAIRASLTGHLVLSTLHCNDAPSAIPRLVDMGIEPFMLSTALIGVTAQRLVRQLCPECREQYSPNSEERSVLGNMYTGDVPLLWRPKGCPRCSGNGYRGRNGVHEILPIGPQMQSLVANCASMDELKKVGSTYGYETMQEDVCRRVVKGETSFNEARRLIFFDTVSPAQYPTAQTVPQPVAVERAA
ncbi:MAG: type secretion system protein [Capsulimonas sp.]|jgi:type IV pilus assembly protein PilB|nr:type secretion system protein [Capsulimonas sp.]